MKQKPMEQFTVTIVYDGMTPYLAALNLCRYISALGGVVNLISSKLYHEDVRCYGQCILIGHHRLALRTLHRTQG